MKALVKREAAPGLWLEDVPEPEMGINDVLIRVKRTAICGTDVHIHKWDAWAAKTIPTPMVVGHEFVGEIVDVGSNVQDFHKGDLVSAEGHVVCGVCRNCMAGRRHMCRYAEGIGVNRPGAFAEYIAVPAANIWVHAKGIDPDIAALFDPFGNAVHTALQFDLLGEDVLITGAGPIGQMAVAVCRHAGARHVVITDVVDNRLARARQLGATRTVNVSRESLAEVQRDLGMQEGFDVGLEMSGNATAFRSMVDHMNHGGKIAVLGLPEDGFELDWHKVIFSMMTIKGVYGREIFESWYKMAVFIQSGMDLSPVITHRLPFHQFEDGFQAIFGGDAGKVILNWEDV